MAAQNVILERIEAQQRVVIDAVTMTREALERKLDDVGRRLSGKIDVLEFAVRKNSADIQTLTVKVEKNSADIQHLGEKLDTKTDAGRTNTLEQRVEALETSIS